MMMANGWKVVIEYMFNNIEKLRTYITYSILLKIYNTQLTGILKNTFKPE